MSHKTTVNLIADQEIEIAGVPVNIHDIKTIIVDGKGQIIDFYPIYPEAFKKRYFYCGAENK